MTVSRRERPAKSALSREVIVATGLQVLDAEGMDALTMRRVAQQLDTGAASLYVYVKNRDDLLVEMLDLALADVVLPDESDGSWRERVKLLGDRMVAALGQHEGLALVALGRIASGPSSMRIGDAMIGILREGGLDHRTIAWAVDLIALHITVAAAELSAHIAAGHTEDVVVAEAREKFADLDPARYPNFTAFKDLLLEGGGDARETWAFDVLLAGIEARRAGT